jgi:hypothetical protein
MIVSALLIQSFKISNSGSASAIYERDKVISILTLMLLFHANFFSSEIAEQLSSFDNANVDVEQMPSFDDANIDVVEQVSSFENENVDIVNDPMVSDADDKSITSIPIGSTGTAEMSSSHQELQPVTMTTEACLPFVCGEKIKNFPYAVCFELLYPHLSYMGYFTLMCNLIKYLLLFYDNGLLINFLCACRALLVNFCLQGLDSSCNEDEFLVMPNLSVIKVVGVM